MSLFTNKASLETQLAEATQKLTASETHIVELEEENKTFAENVKAATDAAETARNEAKADKEAHVTAVNAANDFKKTVADLLGIEGEVTEESVKKSIDEKAHAKALDIASSQGAPPVKTSPAASGQSAEELLAAYEATPEGTKRTEFFRANKKAIEKANAQLKAGNN